MATRRAFLRGVAAAAAGAALLRRAGAAESAAKPNIVLIIAEVLLMIFAPGQTTLMLVSAIGLILFAGFTVYDAQQTRAIFAQYSGQDPEMIKKISILCALNLYLDFVNMFLYILQLLGDRE